MEKITKEQQELLAHRIVPILNKDTDYYIWGRNTRIIVGDDIEAAQRIIVNETDHHNVDWFFEGYWNGIEALLFEEEMKTVTPSDVIIEVKIFCKRGGWSGTIDNQETFIPDILCAIRNGKNPIDALAFLAHEGSHTNNIIGKKNRIGDYS